MSVQKNELKLYFCVSKYWNIQIYEPWLNCVFCIQCDNVKINGFKIHFKVLVIDYNGIKECWKWMLFIKCIISCIIW